jgi:sugar fermentation stimulation protein A
VGEVSRRLSLFPGGKVVRSTFIDRPNRFTAICRIGRQCVRAYLPNPGRMSELLLPGSTLLLLKEPKKEGRKTDATVVAVEKEGTPVLLHTHRTNNAAHWLVDQDLVPGLEGYRVLQSEVTRGHSRFDFLLGKEKRRLLLEVKSCTLFGREIAMFPDAVTARGARHVRELTALSGPETGAGVLFVIHWPRARFFIPEYHTDPEFSRALSEARDRLLVKAVAVRWGDDLSLSPPVKEAVIPWELVEREDHDGGSYVVILRLRRRRRIRIGQLGTRTFEKGYYLYVGSARKNLSRRVERHRRGGVKHFWHIDYLREHADFHNAFPVRSPDPLECRIAAALEKVAGGRVEGFGSSDCSCPSHLFFMDHDPLVNRGFVDLDMFFRIARRLDDEETVRLFPEAGLPKRRKKLVHSGEEKRG